MEDLKTYADDNVKLWRADAIVWRIADSDEFAEFRFVNPVPVYSGERLVGAATLEVRGRDIYATIAMDYALPERLEVQNGDKIWALPREMSYSFMRVRDEDTGKTVNIPSTCSIASLELRKDSMDFPSLGQAAL